MYKNKMEQKPVKLFEAWRKFNEDNNQMSPEEMLFQIIVDKGYDEALELIEENPKQYLSDSAIIFISDYHVSEWEITKEYQEKYSIPVERYSEILQRLDDLVENEMNKPEEGEWFNEKVKYVLGTDVIKLEEHYLDKVVFNDYNYLKYILERRKKQSIHL